jgi:DNA polymerase-3 subunit epsilon
MTLRAIYYDTETTGISPTNDRVVELAAYDPQSQTSFERLINPQMPIPQEASRVHNITDAMVKDAPTFALIGKEFIDFCQGGNNGDNVVLIAHNNDSFDIHFLKNEFQRAGLEMPQWKFLDTLKWARRYRPDLPRHSLQFLRETYGFPANNAHRALDDVIILHQVFSCMTDDLHFDQVFSLMMQDKPVTHMPFGKHQGKPLEEVPQDYITWLSKSEALQKPENQKLKEQLVKLGRI